jgi:catechol 2,3-dioxygenase-like lactoylglutathione lyase family enzyme
VIEEDSVAEQQQGPSVISHIGVLVTDLDAAIERWSRLTGWTFRGPMYYEPDTYSCAAAPEAHPHSQRIAFSVQGPPYVELLEVNPDEPTHDASQLGFHHVAFDGVEDIEAVLARFQDETGVDGLARDADGNTLLFFADPASPAGFDGIRVEYVSAAEQPVRMEDDAS